MVVLNKDSKSSTSHNYKNNSSTGSISPEHHKTLSEEMKAKFESKHVPKGDATPEYKKKSDSVTYCVKDGLFASIKNGLTENFVMPFAIALNATNSMIAALGSVPTLVASTLQLFSQDSLKFFKTRRRLIVWTSIIQAFLWLPLLFIPLIAGDNLYLAFTLLIIFYTLEIAIGNFQGPIYNSILGDIIDEDKRGEFFGKRNRVVSLMGFISTFVAGLILSYFRKTSETTNSYYIFIGFGIIFFLAFVFRLISAYYKSKLYDPEYTPKKRDINFIDFIKNMDRNNYGIFVMYIFLFRLAVNISAPFFALYLLKDMQLSYFQFTVVLGVAVIFSFLTMGIWGKIIDRYGSKIVLSISGFLLPVSPILLIFGIYFSDPNARFLYLLFVEAVSGILWGAFNLSTSAFLFDATSKEERVQYIAYYNFLGGIAVFIGAMLGGLLIDVYPVWIVSTIPFVLLTSGLLRLIATAVFIRRIHEARMVEIDVPGRGFFHNIISINPRSVHHLEIIGTYDGGNHQSFHSVIPRRKKNLGIENHHTIEGKPVFKSKEEEKKYYENKTFEYYKQNAMKTLDKNPKLKDTVQNDKSSGAKDPVSKITDDIKRGKYGKK